jgi:hypothetical protein
MLVAPALAGGGADPAPAPPVASQSFASPLLGQNEVPPPGLNSASGFAQTTVNRGTNLVCVDYWVAGVTPTAAHIHRGNREVAGPVVVDVGIAPSFVGATSRGRCNTVEAALAADIAANPANFYVNVHSAEFPAGAIRGQLGTPWSAQLNGRNEVPGPGSAAGSGVAWMAFDAAQRAICVRLEVNNVPNVTASHIHRGTATESGPIVVDFGADVVTGATPAATGAVLTAQRTNCVVGIAADLFAAIVANPAGYYYNVHSTEFPAGAVRGQLMR